MPLPTVVLHSRNLREAGLRSTAARGRGAGNIGSLDAARLLLATAGASSPKDSLIPVQRHGRMQAAEGAWNLSFLPIPELGALAPNHTLEDALVALVEAGMSGSLEAAAGAPIDTDGPPPLLIDVTLWEPMARSTISVRLASYDGDGALMDNSDVETRTYDLAAKIGKGNLDYDPPLDLAMHGDLRHRHSFGQATILAVATLLRLTS